MEGVVYTKDWVVRLMLDAAGYLSCEDLAAKVVIEPSCGQGAFLGELMQRLITSAKSHGKCSPSFLTNSIRAYDIDPESVTHCRNLVVRGLTEAGFEASEAEALAKDWVHVADSLEAEYPPADWVVGNPPYVRSGHIDRAKREAYAKRFECVTMGTDLYIGFFEKGLQSLKDGGRLCFVCSDRWLQNRFGTRLRRYIGRGFNINAHIRMHTNDVFEDDVCAYPAVTLIDKKESLLHYAHCNASFDARSVHALLAWLNGEESTYDTFETALLSQPKGGAAVPLASPEQVRLITKLEGSLPLLEESGVRVGIGVASGCDEVYVTTDDNLVEQDRLLPLFFMKDWRRGIPQKRYLVNPWDNEGNLVDLDSYPKLKGYLGRHEERLRRRRVAKDSPDRWYRTLDKPNFDLHHSQMLLFPDMAAHADPVLSDGARYPHHNCYWLTSDTWDLRTLGGLLMSDVAEAFVDAFGVKMRGDTLRFQAQYLRMLRVPRYEDVLPDVREDLARAFDARDRKAASKAAHKAYALPQAAA